MEVLPAVRGEEQPRQHPWPCVPFVLVRCVSRRHMYFYRVCEMLTCARRALQVMSRSFAISRDGPSTRSLRTNIRRSSASRVLWAYVCPMLPSACRILAGVGCCCRQRKMLFVHDPKAMHHILVRDQDIFEEVTWFTRCVPALSPTNGHLLSSCRRHFMP